jgi:hypothetical protein
MAPSAAGQMSPAMRQRYGLDRNPWPVRILIAVAVGLFTALLVFFALRLTDQPIEARLLVWQQPQLDRLDITFEVNKPAGLATTCVLRAQDGDRVDVGYSSVELPAPPGYAQQTYRMRVLGPASVVEILACGPTGEPLRVPPPVFPPGVVPPEQPWTDQPS